MQETNLKRNTCDICKTKEILKEKESSTFITLKIPMPYYNEVGQRMNRTSLENVDLCPECTKTLMLDLLKHYDMASIAYAGVQIKRREHSNDT